MVAGRSLLEKKDISSANVGDGSRSFNSVYTQNALLTETNEIYKCKSQTQHQVQWRRSHIRHIYTISTHPNLCAWSGRFYATPRKPLQGSPGFACLYSTEGLFKKNYIV